MISAVERGRGGEKTKFVHGNFICNPKIGIISPGRCFRALKSIKASTQTHTHRAGTDNSGHSQLN